MMHAAPNRYLSIRKLCWLLVSGIALSGPICSPAYAAQAQPSAEESEVLSQYPSFDQPIEIVEANTNNNIHQFLQENVGKTVYMDTDMIVYQPVNPRLTQEQKDLLPTDRFRNEVMSKCWIEPEGTPHHTDFGEKGYPLPLDQADIDSGCATRIRFVLLWGDWQPGTSISRDHHRQELFISGFFEVSSQQIEGGKTLYTLTQKEVPHETDELFLKYKKVKDRPERLQPVTE